ncbi:3-oxoacyl-[acyl-carrier-protein] reductase [soil metagenome]
MSRKNVLVTGASRGIGRAIALELGAQGWKVAVHYSVNAPEAEKVQEALNDSCLGVFRADLSDPRNASDLWAEVSDRCEIDALVNNAGIYVPCSFLEQDDETFDATWSKTLAINLESPMRLMRAAAFSFKTQGGGKILNIASRVGFRGEPGASHYAASKAALINLTRSLSIELAPHKIGVFGVAPGWVDTAMARDGMESRLADIISTIPLGRMASPEDCAAVSAFLLSDAASYLAGQTIDINGASYFH